MGALCEASYLDPGTPPGSACPDRREVLQQAGFTERYSLDQDAIQGTVVETREAFVLAFRGTDKLEDWNANIRFTPTHWPGGGQAHEGFIVSFDAIAAQLVEIRGQLKHKPWLVTGHSLGAVMAVLSAQ